MKWAFLLIFCGVGLGLLIGGLFMAKNSFNLVNNGVQAIGEVIRYETHISSNKNSGSSRTTYTKLYRPVFLFTDSSGHKTEIKTDTSSSSPDYSVGDFLY